MMKDLIKSIEGIVKKEMSEFWNISEETKKVCLKIATSTAESIVIDEEKVRSLIENEVYFPKDSGSTDYIGNVAKALADNSKDILKVVE